MSRKARAYSFSGYYHVVIKGVSDQIIFEDASDNERFLDILSKYTEEMPVKICAYCLMSNHVHMLLYAPEKLISLFMKKIAVSYAGYFNRKYDRKGHLFQNRFFSSPIENEAGFINAFKYILRNPVSAGIANGKMYLWSSYRMYEKESGFIDNTLAHELIGDLSSLNELLDTEEEVPVNVKMDDLQAIQAANSILGFHCSDISYLTKNSRNLALRKLKDHGMSIRQISRITGISRGIVQKV